MRPLVLRLAAPVVGAVLVSTGLWASPAPGRAADARAVLPVYDFTDLAVDDAHGRLFVSGGVGDPLVVRDLNGGAVTTIANMPGAGRMALSEDGSKLYVPLQLGDAISEIDTTTLLETARYRTGAATCPTSVAVVGERVWFAYGCDHGIANLGVVTPGGTPAVALGQVAAGTVRRPVLDSAVNLPGKLVVLDSEKSPQTTLFDVSGEAPSVLAQGPSFVGGVADLDIDPDGSRVLVTPFTQAPATALSSTLLSPIADYPEYGVGSGNAVAAGPGGLVAIGYSPTHKDVVVHRADGPVLRNYDLPGNADGLRPGSIEFSADGSRLFAVAQRPSGSFDLHVLHDPSTATSTIAWTPPSSTLLVGRAFSLVGKLSSTLPVPAGASITVTRSSASGVVRLPSVVASSTGAFTVRDTVSARGSHDYTATWAGDADHHGTSGKMTVRVKGLLAPLSITTATGPWKYASKPLVVAHFGSSKPRYVTLYAQPHQGTKVKIKAGWTDVNGNLAVTYTMHVRTTFTATFSGDSTYEPRWVTRLLTSYAYVSNTLTRHYSTSGSYKLFRSSVDPLMTVTVRPYYSSPPCVDFLVQVYRYGAWRNAATLSCQLPDAYGRTGAVYPRDPAGTRFRMRATFRGTSWNVQTHGAWQYGRFTT